MVCEHSSSIELSGYVDEELQTERQGWWTEHLAGCPSCRAELARMQGLRASVQGALPPREPTSAFRDELRRRIRAERGRDAGGVVGSSSWRLGLAAAALLAVGAGLGRVGAGGGRDALPDEIVAGHVRSLEVDHLVDVASSEHHVVKPWFAGKLDFSPPVPDLAAAGFPLMGARVDYLGGREVAALVYARGPHRINLIVWPASADARCTRPMPTVRQGFNLSHGSAGGMEYWAVSDLNRQELDEFVSRWQREAGGSSAC
jgi:anti-sigma factor RsiW